NDGGPPPGATISVSGGGAVTEGSQVTMTLMLSQPLDHEVSVHYQTRDGSATSPDDYSAAGADAVFGAWQTSVTVPIDTNDDSDVEGPEDFSFSLSNPDGADLGSPSSISITILDNDSRTINIDASASTVEGSAAVLTLTLAAPAA